jgi:hypothetical protein
MPPADSLDNDFETIMSHGEYGTGAIHRLALGRRTSRTFGGHGADREPFVRETYGDGRR